MKKIMSSKERPMRYSTEKPMQKNFDSGQAVGGACP